jgi:hypothetical protein
VRFWVCLLPNFAHAQAPLVYKSGFFFSKSCFLGLLLWAPCFGLFFGLYLGFIWGFCCEINYSLRSLWLTLFQTLLLSPYQWEDFQKGQSNKKLFKRNSFLK